MSTKPLIVIADNNRADRMLIKIAMEELSLDAHILELDSGEKVIEFVKERCNAAAPKFIVLDLDMPKISGLEVLNFLRENADLCSVPAIVFTSHFDELQKQKALDMGAIKYIAKANSLKEHKELVKFMKKKLAEK